MVWPAVIAAGAALASSALSAKSQADANAANVGMSQAQMDFQERSQRNRYQWTMEDMRKAGLNPMLAYQQGGGSSLPGAMARVEPVFKDSNSAKDAVSNAMTVALAKQQLKNLEIDEVQKMENIANTAASTRNITADTLVKMEGTLPSAKAEAEAQRQREQFYKTPLGELMRKIDLIGKSINPFAGAASSARSAVGR